MAFTIDLHRLLLRLNIGYYSKRSYFNLRKFSEFDTGTLMYNIDEIYLFFFYLLIFFNYLNK